MRKLWLAAAVVAGIAGATPAAAQRVWQDGRWVVMPSRSAPTVMSTRGNRWPMVNGRWSAGWEAPGGWNSYRRLGRGASLPNYWMRHRVPDYLSFGLAAPPQGYFWVRYYDDAVLVDGHGRVWDSVGGIGWVGASAHAGGSFSSSESYSSATVGGGYGGGYAEPIRPVDPNGFYAHPGASYDDDPIPYPDAPYPGGYAPPVAPPPAAYVQPYPAPCYQACGGPSGAYQGGSFYGGNAYQSGSYQSSGGYSYGAGATTVIITTPAPVTTTTVIEETIVEEEVVSTSYVRSTPRRTVRRAPVRKYRPKAKAKSCCVCVCR